MDPSPAAQEKFILIKEVALQIDDFLVWAADDDAALHAVVFRMDFGALEEGLVGGYQLELRAILTVEADQESIALERIEAARLAQHHEADGLPIIAELAALGGRANRPFDDFDRQLDHLPTAERLVIDRSRKPHSLLFNLRQLIHH